MRESLSAPRCCEGRSLRGSARGPVRRRSAAAAELLSNRRRHRPRRGRAPGTAAGRRGRRRGAVPGAARRACGTAGVRGTQPAGAPRPAPGGLWRAAAPGRERGGPAGAGSGRSPGRSARSPGCRVASAEPSGKRGEQHSTAGVLRNAVAVGVTLPASS